MRTKQCQISEKSLELNVCENIVNILRQQISNKAYIYGFTVKSEGLHGLDVSIRLPLTTRILGLQFKRPYKYYQTEYIFYINNNKKRDQHLKILLAAIPISILGLLPSIFYALPTFCQPQDIESASPKFLTQTFFVDPLEIPFTGTHKYEIRINTRNNTAIFRGSKEKKITIYTSEEFIAKIKRNEWGVAVNDLLRIKDVPLDKVLQYIKYETDIYPDLLGFFLRKHLRQYFRAIAMR